jgi:hypothetical protein
LASYMLQPALGQPICAVIRYDARMSFRFHHYTAAELAECGRAFKTEFEFSSLESTAEWTAGVCDWFRRAAADGARVFPPRTGRKEEFLVDLCHTSYPPYAAGESWPCLPWYERTLDGSAKIKLALESEWGKWGVADQSLVMVLDDACKLAVLRAQTKVIIFASHWDDDRERAAKQLERLRRCHADTDPWLWIDVPNRRSTLMANTPRDIRYGVFT